MTERELQSIAELAQRQLYHEHGDVWNIDKPVNCGDFVMEMGALLDSLGMTPDDAEELERKAKNEEFAEFVDALVKNPLDYALTRAKEVFSGCDSEDTTTHKLADSVKQLRRLKLHLDGDDRRAVHAMAVELAKRHAAALGHAAPATADDDALLGSLADAQAAADPDRTGPMVSGKEIA